MPEVITSPISPSAWTVVMWIMGEGVLGGGVAILGVVMAEGEGGQGNDGAGRGVSMCRYLD